MRLKIIRDRFEAWKRLHTTAPLPPDDTAWLIDRVEKLQKVADAAGALVGDLEADDPRWDYKVWIVLNEYLEDSKY